jgi:hypothetical protein
MEGYCSSLKFLTPDGMLIEGAAASNEWFMIKVVDVIS